MTNLLTEEMFVRVLPKKMKTQVNTALITSINNIITDPILGASYRDNLLCYASVMQDGRFKMEDYLNAVRYVSCKLFSATNIEAYTKTFPDRYQQFLTNGTSEKDIASYVTSYNKNKLVNLIMEQTLIPTHILNADVHQKAVNKLAQLMASANSEKVQMEAANSLLTHLKVPEKTKIELDINIKEDSAIADLRASTLKLVKAQHAAIAGGVVTARDVAHSKLEVAPDEDILEGDFTVTEPAALPAQTQEAVPETNTDFSFSAA